MNKYERQIKLVEDIPEKINKYKLHSLLLNYKMKVAKHNDFIKFKELNNDLCIIMIISKWSKCSDNDREYLKKHILNKIDINCVYGTYVRHICNYLLDKNYDEVNNLLESFVVFGLVKSARLIISDKQDLIEVMTVNNRTIKFSHCPLSKELIDSSRGYCHDVTSCFMKDCLQRKAVVALVKRELCGHFYHSFIVDDGIVFDFSHNIMMLYNDYIELINPEIIVYDSGENILEEIKKLENDEDYRECGYIDLLKCGISKQFASNKKLVKVKDIKQKK